MYVPPAEYVVQETEHWLVNHCVDATLPGYLIVSSRDPAAGRLADLSVESRRALGPLLADLDAALDAVLSPAHVYFSRWGHEPGHTVHFHVIPVPARIVEEAENDARYQVLKDFHATDADGDAGRFDGPDLTVFVVREHLEHARSCPVDGPTVVETVRRLREWLASA